jgi:hypothetical protein
MAIKSIDIFQFETLKKFFHIRIFGLKQTIWQPWFGAAVSIKVLHQIAVEFICLLKCPAGLSILALFVGYTGSYNVSLIHPAISQISNTFPLSSILLWWIHSDRLIKAHGKTLVRSKVFFARDSDKSVCLCAPQTNKPTDISKELQVETSAGISW